MNCSRCTISSLQNVANVCVSTCTVVYLLFLPPLAYHALCYNKQLESRIYRLYIIIIIIEQIVKKTANANVGQWV